MTKRPFTMADIARHAGVSKATVSAVVNGKGSVREETRAKVQAVMDRFRYRPQPGAGVQGARTQKALGFIIKEAANPYYAETLAGIQAVAQKAGYLVQVASSGGDIERERQLVGQFSAQNVDGIIITPILHDDADLSHLFDLKRLNVPFVLLERVPGLPAPLVDIDNVEAARAATAHLIEAGHTEITHLAGPSYSAHSEERSRGFRLAFSASSLALSEDDIVPTGDSLREGYEASRALLKSGRRPTAITCYNDLVALGALRALNEAGLDVPGDVAVMGFDDLELLEYLPTPLSTVRVPKRDMGKRAAEMLIRHIESDDRVKPERVTLEAKLVVRDSTGSMARMLVFLAVLLSTFSVRAVAQDIYLGADLSYVNQMEDCGAVYKEDGVSKDPYRIFADQGNNLVRLRLWVDPSWQNSLSQPAGVKGQYSDFDDVREAIQRSKDAGMQVLLDFHYSDFWADPGRQVIPARWASVGYNTDALADSVYQYTHSVLTRLDADGLMPELVQVGNETNPGMLLYLGMNSQFEGTGFVSGDWDRQAALFNAGIRAVREAGAASDIDPKIVIHFANPQGAVDRVRRLFDHGITDFDIIGLSFYYTWHGHSVNLAGAYVSGIGKQFPDYEVAIVETGYLWTTRNADSSPNIISTGDPAYAPISPRKQLEYMVDLTRKVLSVGGVGVVFWEPAWVSTSCRTPWAQGSSHDHVAFFDQTNTNFMADGGGRWTNPTYYQDLDAPKTRFKVDMTGQDVSAGVYLNGDAVGVGGPVPMSPEGNGIYSTFLHLSSGTVGGYFFQTGRSSAVRESVPSACAGSGDDRRFRIGTAETTYGFEWGSCVAFGNATSVESVETPVGLRLSTIAPNPVGSVGMVHIELPAAGFARLALYDLLGREVSVLAAGLHEAGAHKFRLDASSLRPGLYLVRLSVADAAETKPLTVVR